MPKLLSRCRLSLRAVVGGRARRRPGRCRAARRRGRCACRSGRSRGRRSRTRGSRSARRRRCRAPCPSRSSSESLSDIRCSAACGGPRACRASSSAVNAMRPSLRSLAANDLARRTRSTVRPSLGDPGAERVPRVRRPSPGKAASNVIWPLRTEVSTFTSAIRAPAGVPTR